MKFSFALQNTIKGDCVMSWMTQKATSKEHFSLRESTPYQEDPEVISLHWSCFTLIFGHFQTVKHISNLCSFLFFDVIDGKKSSNIDLMQTFFGRDNPFLALFKKPYFQQRPILSRFCVPVSHNNIAQKIQKVSFSKK